MEDIAQLNTWPNFQRKELFLCWLMAIPYYNTTPVTDEQSAQPYRYSSHT